MKQTLQTCKLTFIVPIYNIEKYIANCLDSFVNQTNSNFKVLLLDDGSTDASSDIASKYAALYPNIFEYYKQENKGLGGTRNKGLELVKTKYCVYFDGDDYTSNRAVEKINNFIDKLNEDVDGIFYNPIIYDTVAKNFQIWHDADLIKSIFDKDIINVSKHPKLFETEASVCRTIWKTSFLKESGLKFLEHCCWEDVPPHFLLLHKANSIAFLNEEGLYYYRSNTQTQITSQGGKTRLDIRIVLDNIKPFFESNEWSKIEKIHILSFLANYLFWFVNVIDSEYRKELILVLHKFFLSLKGRLLLKFYFTKNIEFKRKLRICFLRSRLFYKVLLNQNRTEKYKRMYAKLRGCFK